MRRIQSKKHKSGTYEIAKIPFSYFDNKRYMFDVGIYTLSYFYKKQRHKLINNVMVIFI